MNYIQHLSAITQFPFVWNHVALTLMYKVGWPAHTQQRTLGVDIILPFVELRIRFEADP